MPKLPLRILCFGDSLTAGYSGWGSQYHPYSEMLCEKLAAAFPDRNVQVLENGAPGDIVSSHPFLNRLNQELHRPPFHWVIILGGTNDLGYGIDVSRIFGTLQEIWAAPLSKGSKVLALTVPECAVKKESLDRKRNELNSNILGYKKPNFYTFDLHAMIPYHSLADEDREKYWDDGLHLTSEGYDWMGAHVAEALIPLINSEPDMPATPPPSTGAIAHETRETVLFEEESGDPRRINEGYVVVRKKDLD